MVTISFFTRPVPLELLGALTWQTIDRPRYRESAKSAEYVVSADVRMEKVKVEGRNLIDNMYSAPILLFI